MKRILSLFLCFMTFCAIKAGTIQKGYHGFADVGYGYCDESLAPTTIDITTSHGYQFSPYIFLGAGIGFDFTGKAEYGNVDGHPFQKRDAMVDIPVFFNGRLNFTKTKVVPFLDLKAGSYVNNGSGLYTNFMVGCRFPLSDNSGLSISVGGKIASMTIQNLKMSTGKYTYSLYYEDEKNHQFTYYVLKIGCDF